MGYIKTKPGFYYWTSALFGTMSRLEQGNLPPDPWQTVRTWEVRPTRVGFIVVRVGYDVESRRDGNVPSPE